MTKPPPRKGRAVPQGRPDAVEIRASRDDLLSQCRVDTFRSGGKGGQHQNKVESGVRLTHRPTGIVVTSRKHRSQHRNREEALRRLGQKLDDRRRVTRPRVPTRVPSREKRKRREDKLKRSRLKRLRARPESEEP